MVIASQLYAQPYVAHSITSFLTRNSVTMVPLLAYSLDLAANDFFLYTNTENSHCKGFRAGSQAYGEMSLPECILGPVIYLSHAT